MQNILVKEKEFYAKINEQIKQVEKNEKVILTKFLTLREQKILTEASKFGLIQVSFYGGYDNAERKKALLYPNTFTVDSEFNITCFNIKYNKRYLKLTHQSVLGTLMSLKMDRSLFGDIVFIDDECFFFVTSDIEAILINEFIMINRVPITIEKNDDDLVVNGNYKLKEIIISSMRIDNLIGRVYNLSRDNAKEYVLSKFVYKNDQIVNSPALKCEVNDIISVRKKGRFIISNLLRNTKANKIVLEIKIPTT